MKSFFNLDISNMEEDKLQEDVWNVSLEMRDVRQESFNVNQGKGKSKRPRNGVKHHVETNVGNVFRSYPLGKLNDFIRKTLNRDDLSYSLYDPFKMGIQFSPDNFDKICFHFTLAVPMKTVSLKGVVAFYHWFNIYIFLDKTIYKSELDWEARSEVTERKWRRKKKNVKKIVEAKFTSGLKYPSYMKKLEQNRVVLVQDVDSIQEYPPKRTFLAVTKEKLQEVIQTNCLIGEKYDFTKLRHCQFWCLWENQRLGLGTQFSCQFVNDLFDSSPSLRIVGSLLKKFVVKKMDIEDSDDGESEAGKDSWVIVDFNYKEQDKEEEDVEEDYVKVVVN